MIFPAKLVLMFIVPMAMVTLVVFGINGYLRPDKLEKWVAVKRGLFDLGAAYCSLAIGYIVLINALNISFTPFLLLNAFLNLLLFGICSISGVIYKEDYDTVENNKEETNPNKEESKKKLETAWRWGVQWNIVLGLIPLAIYCLIVVLDYCKIFSEGK